MKKLIWIIVVIAIVIVGFLIWGSKSNRVSAPSRTEVAPAAAAPGSDKAAAINQDVNSLDVGDLNQEFQSIDADLNQL